MTIRVLLADDQALIRAGFAALVDSEPDMTVVGQAIDGADAVRHARTARPDVVLMDIRMPGTDGIAATQLLTADPGMCEVRILVLTTFEQDDLVLGALRAGASGFLGKGAGPHEPLAAIRTITAGDALLSPKATRAVIERIVTHQEEPAGTAEPGLLDVLTDRERQIVALVAQGLSNEEIAEKLHVSPLTAKTHVNRAMIKLEARDRAHLVVLAYRAGLVQPGHRARPKTT